MPCALPIRSEEHTSELQSHDNLVCRLLLEKQTEHRGGDPVARAQAARTHARARGRAGGAATAGARPAGVEGGVGLRDALMFFVRTRPHPALPASPRAPPGA